MIAEPEYDVEDIIAAAEQHGEESDPGHEAGDLQGALRAAWNIMTEEQRKQLLKDGAIVEIFESVAS